jgi:hypothetical protein
MVAMTTFPASGSTGTSPMVVIGMATTAKSAAEDADGGHGWRLLIVRSCLGFAVSI